MNNDSTQPAAPGKSSSLLQEYASELGNGSPGVAARAATAADPGPSGRNLEMIMRIPVTVKVVLGSTTMPVANLVKLGRGAVIPLDRRVGEPADVVVNGRVVARGEVVIVDEATSRFGIKLTEVVGSSGTDKPV
ncbi:MAG TPA: flagellar motor switch protein FliN [Hyphomicrobiaceae bacterium]|nr:flagellar motor switch protein FliN [Hyphomicrobiaceae bacterium]